MSARRIKELERIVAELYQVIGALALRHNDCFGHPDVQKALDNAGRAKLVHRDLMPFPRLPLYGRATVYGKRKPAKRG